MQRSADAASDHPRWLGVLFQAQGWVLLVVNNMPLLRARCAFGVWMLRWWWWWWRIHFLKTYYNALRKYSGQWRVGASGHVDSQMPEASMPIGSICAALLRAAACLVLQQPRSPPPPSARHLPSSCAGCVMDPNQSRLACCTGGARVPRPCWPRAQCARASRCERQMRLATSLANRRIRTRACYQAQSESGRYNPRTTAGSSCACMSGFCCTPRQRPSSRTRHRRRCTAGPSALPHAAAAGGRASRRGETKSWPPT